MNQYNPYQAPQTNDPVFGGGGAGPNESAQAASFEALKKTRPWVIFLSILGFLGAGGMVLVGFFMLIFGSAMKTVTKGPMDGLSPVLSLFYFVLGAFQVVPSVLLFQYGSSIGDFSRSGGSIETLAVAVKKQASFWKFTGIAMAVIIGIYVVAIIVAVVVGVAAGLSR